MGIKHAKTSGKGAPADPSKVGGSDWDADHVVQAGTALTGLGSLGVGTGLTAFRRVQIDNATATDETSLWVQDTATGHVGTGANQAIACVLREMGTSNCTATAATATGLDVAVTQTRSAGANALTNTAVLANASGGQVNYSWFSSLGEMVQTQAAHFGAVDCTSLVNSGSMSAGASSLGATTIAGLATIGVAPTGSTHVVNGNVNVRSDAVDTWVNIRNLSTGGREYFIEASGNGGTDPNCLAVYDNTAGATRLKIDSSGNVIANVAMGAGGARWRSGTGSPEGVVTGNKGDLFSRTDGGAGTCLYVKETNGGNTGWVAK